MNKVAVEEVRQFFGVLKRLEGLSTSVPGCKASLLFVRHTLAAPPAPALSWNPAAAPCRYCQAEEGVPTVRGNPSFSPFLPPLPPSLHFHPSTPRVPASSLFFPLLQACVMSLSPDSWHVNEDVMRLTDMQLI